MGPHSFECGNLGGLAPQPTPEPRFNGAALVRVRKYRASVIAGQAAQALQWGRTRSSAEMPHARESTSCRSIQLQWGRTRSSAEIRKVTFNLKLATTRFNGAALVRVRKCSLSKRNMRGRQSFNGAALVRVRKWINARGRILASAGFNGAALVRVRKFHHSPREACMRKSFNGAALVRVRKSASYGSRGLRYRLASMGPHSFECGNRGGLLHISTCFRASMGPPSFECGNQGCLPSGTTTDCRFNGAALVRVRKCLCRRDRAEAEELASMGPHSFECGNLFVRSPSPALCQASMGPHSFECGNLLANAGIKGSEAGLQWGRTRSSAEMPRRAGPPRARAAASMGPHSFECGNVGVLVADDVPAARLQWGRTRSSAEIAPVWRQGKRGQRASMGPHSFECGNR